MHALQYVGIWLVTSQDPQRQVPVENRVPSVALSHVSRSQVRVGVRLDTWLGLGPVQSIVGFVRRMITITDEDMYQLVGMDALVYTRFYRWGLETFTFAFVVGMLILLPTNYFGASMSTGLDRLSLSNIDNNAPALWAHFVVAHLVFVFATWRLHLLYNMVTHQSILSTRPSASTFFIDASSMNSAMLLCACCLHAEQRTCGLMLEFHRIVQG